MLKKKVNQVFSREKATVVALGDSLTDGWLEEKGYFDFLIQWLEQKFPLCTINFINRGVPGDTSSGGLNRLHQDVIVNNPDLVFIQFALNDFFMGVSVEVFSSNIDGIITEIKETTKAVPVLVTSVPLMTEDALEKSLDKFYLQLIQIGQNQSIPVAKVHHYWKRRISEGEAVKNLLQSDGVHPTMSGYRLMAEAIWELF